MLRRCLRQLTKCISDHKTPRGLWQPRASGHCKLVLLLQTLKVSQVGIQVWQAPIGLRCVTALPHSTHQRFPLNLFKIVISCLWGAIGLHQDGPQYFSQKLLQAPYRKGNAAYKAPSFPDSARLVKMEPSSPPWAESFKALSHCGEKHLPILISTRQREQCHGLGPAQISRGGGRAPHLCSAPQNTVLASPTGQETGQGGCHLKGEAGGQIWPSLGLVPGTPAARRTEWSIVVAF